MKQVLLLLGMSLTYADWFGGDDHDMVPHTEDNDSTEVEDIVEQDVESVDGVVDLLGANTDENGCLTSAGFSWCESKGACIQIFVEGCDDDDNTNLEDFLNSILSPDDHIPDFDEGNLYESEDEETDLTDDETDLTPVVMIGSDRDDNDCIASAGYTWCEKKGECVRSWLLEGEWDDECTVEEMLLGGDQDENDCIASAGYTWCEKQEKCVKSWELEGDWDDECTIETTSDSFSGESTSYEDISSSEGSSEGSSSSSDSKAGASESTQDDLAKFFYNEDGTIKPWVFKVFLGLSITAAVLLVCLIRVRRLRKRRQRRRRRSAGVQMLASNTDNYERFNGDEDNFVFQETVAVKFTEKDEAPNRKEFTNLV